MSKFFQFGEKIEGYNIPVLNEREVRASAGILFFFTFLSFMFIVFKQDFTWIKNVITIFLIDFSIRVFINPKYSPTLIIGRWIVRKQTPEYVGAAQKKFAWYIGFGMALTMFVLMVMMNTYSAISGIICLICMIFLFFEANFGICLGCIFYKWFYKEKAQYCPGEICEIKEGHLIQRTSWVHFLIVLIFAAIITLIAIYGYPFFKEVPHALFG